MDTPCLRLIRCLVMAPSMRLLRCRAIWLGFMLLLANCRPRMPITVPSGSEPGTAVQVSGPAVPSTRSFGPIKIVAPGARRSCAVHESGQVTCRGRGRPTHAVLSEVEHAEGVVHHGDEICAWTRTGEVRCQQDSTTAWPNAGFPVGIVQLSAGGQLCALDRDNRVWCRGWGPGRAEISSLAARGGAVELAVGSVYHCVRDSLGVVSCLRGSEVLQPFPDVHDARQISAHGETLCVLRANGSVRCLAMRTLAGSASVETALPQLPPFTAIAAGEGFGCGRSADGTVTCWGENDDGQLGVVGLSRDRPAQVGGIDDAEGLFVGPAQVCVRRRELGVWCWGNDEFGSIGAGPGAAQILPGSPLYIPGLRGLALANDRSCAWRSDGSILCWGAKAAARPTPVAIPGRARSLVSNRDFDCAVLEDGRVACRTVSSMVDRTTPEPSQGWWKLAGLEHVRGLQLLLHAGVSLHEDDTLSSLSIRPTPQIDRPTPLPRGLALALSLHARYVISREGNLHCAGARCLDTRSLTDVVAVAATLWDIVCALRSDGSLRCADEQSGRPLSPIPGRYSGLGASEANLCALTAERRQVLCWGDPPFGEPARGRVLELRGLTVTELPEPALALAVSDTHACAMFSGERLSCWGSNRSGQLGNGRTGVRSTPAPYAP